MKFKAEIDIMPLDELLDPQGKVVEAGLAKLEIEDIEKVRIGKHINIELEAQNKEKALETIKRACEKLLANLVVEKYKINIEEL